ncbi:MAG: ISNCY family transposase [Chloroflexi bacterium]|nr:ISNCY family transposase [Chloroflexota bacterium]
MSDTLLLTKKELGRVQVLEQLKAKTIKQRQAAQQLNLSVRQVKRLLRAFRRQGAQAVLSQRRGRPSAHQLPKGVKVQAVELLRQRYADFGPTLAHEKLTEVHHLTIGVETVRQVMIQEGLWKPHRAKRPVVQPLRERRARWGELVQIDGSPFAWFEDRAPACTLLVFIDDATSQLMELRFVEAETTFSYFEATEAYLQRYGKPVAFYSDKLGVFRVNLPNSLTGEGTTQFGRAMYQLNIQLLCANTPQAKGRVEKANRTLQDRLVKEMRLRGIASMAQGNAYVPAFREDYNRRFAVSPRSAENAHRPLLPQDDLARILTVQELRHLSKNLTFNYHNVIYQIQTPRPTYALRRAQVVVREDRHGTIGVEYRGKPLAFTVYHRQLRQAEETPSKLIEVALTGSRPRQRRRRARAAPAANHPWRLPFSPKAMASS